VIYLIEPTAAQLQRLNAKNFEKFDEEAWLVSPSKGKLSSRVAEPRNLDEYLHVFAEAFATNDQRYEKALHRAATTGHRHFVLYFQRKGRWQSAPLVLSNVIGGLYNIGTFPSARRRGFATEVVEHLLAIAEKAAVSEDFLQVEDGGAANRFVRKARVSASIHTDWFATERLGRSSNASYATIPNPSVNSWCSKKLPRRGNASVAGWPS
jgi:ribosomal protein S18 acetylase RimI-like enzyme